MSLPLNAIDEILINQQFIDWANGLCTKEALEWEDWLKNNSEKRYIVQEALTIFNALKINEKKPSITDIEFEKNKLLHTIAAYEMKPKTISISNYKWVWVAAASVMIIIASAIVWVNLYKPEVANTSFGENMEKKLPDGSSVILNSNSTIKYSPKWNNDKQREVWVKGEAFFSVSQTANKSTFIVHANKFDVVVTGTKFNITSSANGDAVFLEEGSIIVETKNGKKLFMQPGDYLKISDDEMQGKPIHKIQVPKENILAWLSKKIVFENTTLQEVASKITAIYGATVVFENQFIMSKKITGIMPNNDLETLLKALELTSDVSIKQVNDTIYINTNNQ